MRVSQKRMEIVSFDVQADAASAGQSSKRQITVVLVNPNCDRLLENPAKVIVFRCQCLIGVLLIYITCRIFCAKGITVSQICCELLHFEMLVF
jgi:hypothetical protein